MKRKIFLATLLCCVFLSINLFGCVSKQEPASVEPTDDAPKKYFTLSCDDGVTQDARVIEILKKYNAKGTFFINSGLLGKDSSDDLSALLGTSVEHKTWTKEEIEGGIYAGMDVACHTYTHPSLKDLGTIKKILEVQKDVTHITEMTGIEPIGMAWPGGDPCVDEACVETVAKYTSIKFARCTTATGKFDLPERFLRWYPTASALDPNILTLADAFLEADCSQDMLFYVWLHGYELDYLDAWDTFETLIAKMAEDENIVIVTNTEFYQLFRSEIPS